jgi:hypothetical protein
MSQIIFKLSAGHIYSFGAHSLTLKAEHGFALGGGRMASLFADGRIGEGGDNAFHAGLRVYFGQRDKSLMDRHRQDDPEDDPQEGRSMCILAAGGCYICNNETKTCRPARF